MADKALSGLLLLMAAVFGAFLFYRRLRSEGGEAVGPALPTGSGGGRMGAPPVLPPILPSDKPARPGYWPFGRSKGVPGTRKASSYRGVHIPENNPWPAAALEDWRRRGLPVPGPPLARLGRMAP